MKMSVMCVCALTPELPFSQEELEIAKPTIITGMHTLVCAYCIVLYYYQYYSTIRYHRVPMRKDYRG
jgi:hypothetical protein